MLAYDEHYFLPDFRQLWSRFSESDSQADAERKKAKHAAGGEACLRDFVPCKVALRMREYIQFTLKVQGRAPELKLTDDEVKLLD